MKESFSITSEPPLAKIDAVLAGKIPLYAAFEPDAGRFLEAEGFPGDTLLAYGPIEARKWKVKLTGFKGKVTVEWWRTGDGELVEISDKVPAGDAKAFGDALSAHMRVLGLAQLDGSKTEFALKSVEPFAISTAG